MHRRVFGFENVRIDDFSERSNPIIRHWFLTHFHADHYAGLSKQLLSPQQSTLYCSPITSKLVQAELGVPITKIHTIRIGKPVVLKELDVCVVAIDANHCPGSVMFLFENLESGERALHTGDMRYSPKMKLYKELENVKIHTLYLDTTYCSPKHVFPSQEKCVEQIVQIVKDLWEDQQVLFLIGTYKIGKERILVELCRVLKCRIYAPKDKYELLQMMEFNMDCFTMSEGKSRIHMVRIGELSWNCLDAIRAKYPNYKRIIGFRPTGWTFTSSKDCTKTEKGNVTIYGIPYSEHSSFSELQEFVKFIKPQKLIPTVHNGDKENVRH
jgi:DNA cross-link repair 1A protein